MRHVGYNIISALLSAIFLAASMSVSAEEKPSASVQAVDLNTATQAQLETLPGIGPSKAQAIIAHRTRRPFKKVDELMRVKGIGRKTYQKLVPYLTVSSAQK